ncbi:fimbria assembly protein [Kalamiella sp. sgz302252]|uniref:fimbria assembly protein n=1 Tax=Pantoea sp. sgz302252 TaxID=3341827 RepID=UPI0036D405F4
MLMNKLRLFIAHTGALMTSALLCYTPQTAATNALGEINIRLTATVVAVGCTVDPDDINKPVRLGEWQTKQLQKTGQTTTAVPFSIHLLGCTADSVKLTFTGAKDSSDSSLLAIDAQDDSAAQGVAIEILDNGHSRIPVGEATPPAVADARGNATLNFWANYVSTANVKPGKANASALFTLNYD